MDFIGTRSFGDGCALSHACAWGAEMASSLALSTVDAPSSRERKPAFSRAAHNMLPSIECRDGIVSSEDGLVLMR